jgi:uncharacterized membrane protein
MNSISFDRKDRLPKEGESDVCRFCATPPGVCRCSWKSGFLSKISRGLLLLMVFCPVAPLGAQTRLYPLGYLDGFGPVSEANAVTRDGTKIIGYSASSLTENHACWWTTNGIALVPGTQNWYANTAYGISADGNVIIGGRSWGLSVEAFYWTPAGQIQLVPFPEAPRGAVAQNVTGDGMIVVGTVIMPDTLQQRAYRWDRNEATAVFLPPYPSSSVPNTVGSDIATGKGVGFKWTAAGGVVALANPTTGYYAIESATAMKISGDGRMIVGFGVNVAGDDEAIIWFDEQPYRVIDVAYAAGVLPSQWEPFRAYGVDYFGNTMRLRSGHEWKGGGLCADP